MRRQVIDPAAIEAAIEQLGSCARDALRRRWRLMFGRTPPAAFSKDLLARVMACRMQESAFGGLDRESLEFLDGLARQAGPPASAAQSRNGAGPRLSRTTPHRHRRAGWLRLAGNYLFQPVGDCMRDHRHGLERAQIFRSPSRRR